MPDWVEPVARRLLEDGVPTMLQIASIAVTASAVIGIFLGTLLTLRWRPLAAVIRLYIEVWRGLPIIVTILVIYAALPDLGGDMFRFPAWQAAAIGLSLWGSAQVAEATRGAVQSIPKEQHEAASALGFGWVGRHV